MGVRFLYIVPVSDDCAFMFKRVFVYLHVCIVCLYVHMSVCMHIYVCIQVQKGRFFTMQSSS